MLTKTAEVARTGVPTNAVSVTVGHTVTVGNTVTVGHTVTVGNTVNWSRLLVEITRIEIGLLTVTV